MSKQSTKSKDWIGNRSSLLVALGTSSHAVGEREQHDFYATDPKALNDLAMHMQLPYRIYECACGTGHLVNALINLGHEVIATDLIDRGFGEGGVDFLNVESMPKDCDCILTNPPCKFTTEFIEHALNILPKGGKAIFLLNLNILAGQSRFKRIYSRGVLKELYLFSRRISCAKNGDFEQYKSSAVNYAWFVFEKGFCGSTLLHWI